MENSFTRFPEKEQKTGCGKNTAVFTENAL